MTYIPIINEVVYAYLLTSATTYITLAETYYRLEGVFHNEILDNFYINDAYQVTYSGNTSKKFQINVSASFQTDTNNTVFHMALYKNNELQTNSIMGLKLVQTTDINSLTLVDVFDFDKDDNIEIRIKTDKDDVTITTTHVTASIQKWI